jgi:hypothetical protein
LKSGDDELGEDSGAVYVITPDSAGVWSEQQELFAEE